MALDYEKLGAFYLGRPCDASGQATVAEPLLYDSRDLTTHAVCVGMTGSGKTGLCLSLLEEAAIDGIPALCIDPKGDLGNLMLTFPQLRPADFEAWVDDGEARRRGLSVPDYAAKVATQWREGLAEWDQPPERIQRFRDAAEVAIYTPGSDAGLPLSLLQSFAPPDEALRSDADALAERAAAVAASLLTLVNRDADPLQSRDHILLSNLFARTWQDGKSLDLAGLVGAVQRPPFDRLGALDLETFYPARERSALALALNALLASPKLAAWTRGEPLDVQRLLYTKDGRPRIAVLSISHLSDSERMFVVTLLLNEVIGWMRRQPGTSSLRAILYMDEIFGFFPPSANPPSKTPMLTLLKQARAHGLGCVLATQNPVDLDYKGLGNAGTWLVGRLSTERDRDRLAAGLTASSGSADGPSLAAQLASLAPRTFLMRNVHDDAPVVMKSRWALSYLRGPLTLAEITRLTAPLKAANITNADAATRDAGTGSAVADGLARVASPAAAPAAAAPRPALPSGLDEFFAPARGAVHGYDARVLGVARLHYVDKPLKVDTWVTQSFVAPLADDGRDVRWDEAERSDIAIDQLESAPADGAAFAELPAAALRAPVATWTKSLAAALYQNERLSLWKCDAADLVSTPGESEGDFRARIAMALRERRDAAIDALRRKHGPKLQALQSQLQRAQERAERERSQLSQQKLQTAITVGASLLGALMGRKMASATNLGRAATAVKSAGRIGRESDDVTRADEGAGQLQQRLADLSAQFDTEVETLKSTYEPESITLAPAALAPRKADIAVGRVALLWKPWRKGPDGFPVSAE